MISHRYHGKVGRSHRRVSHYRFAAAALVLALTGCDNPLDTTDPDFILPGDLEGEEAIPTLVQGAVGDFTLAYSGSPQGGGTTEGIVMASGLLADEWILSGTFPTRIEVDSRNIEINNGTMTTLFRNLHRARRAAENAAGLVANAGGDPSPVLNLAGYTYLFFAENYCSGVPFSTANPDGSLEFGVPSSTAEIYAVAIERFSSALAAAQAAGNSFDATLANLGIARTRLDMGDFPAAAAVAALVPTSFRFDLDHSLNSPRQENGIFNQNAISRRWTLANGEGGNGLEFRAPGGGMDVRVPSRPNVRGIGFDRSTPQFDLLKYPGRDKVSNVASGIEARLIEAEAALRAGNESGWLQILNDLRDDVADMLSPDHLDALRVDLGIEGNAVTLPPLGDPGTAAGREDLHFRERAFWLYATGSRLSDLRRLVRQYGRNTESVFPTGVHFKGLTYGPDVNFPVPFDEENNPNFDGCLSRET